MLSLATYIGALTPGQANNYSHDAPGLNALLDALVAGSREIADATQTIRQELGADVGLLDHALVVQPLADGLPMQLQVQDARRSYRQVLQSRIFWWRWLRINRSLLADLKRKPIGANFGCCLNSKHDIHF